MLSLATVTPSPLAPLQELINNLIVLVLVLGFGVIALKILSRRPGGLGRFAGVLLEVLAQMAAGGKRSKSSRQALEKAYAKGPRIPSAEYPFQVNARSYFFTRAEGAFFPALIAAADELGLLVFPKVGLCDVFVDSKGAERGQHGRYAQMHVDYLLVRGTDYAPVAGIELNGPSHQSEKQQENDRKKLAVFNAAGLPLLTYYNQPSYVTRDILTRLQDYLGPAVPSKNR